MHNRRQADRDEAADEIDRLRAENEKLRAALQATIEVSADLKCPLTNITIPPEVLEAAAKAAYQRATEANSSSYNDWDDPAQEAARQELIEVIRAACLAMLNAWPKEKK